MTLSKPTSATMSYETITVRNDGYCRTIIFNRPERRNALTHQMMEEIGDAVNRVAQDASVRVLILRGAGDDFSAGGDLSAMANMPPPPSAGEEDPLYAPYRYFGTVLAQLNRLPIAVVAVVKGAAAGGGFGMAVCADVTIVHEDVKFALPEPKVGFIPSQVIPFVTRRIGEGQTRRLAVTGALVGGREAVHLGIAHFVCPDDDALERKLHEVLSLISAMEPSALAAVKGLVLDCAEDDDITVMDNAGTALIDLLRRPTAQQGITAFMNKTKPPWAE